MSNKQAPPAKTEANATKTTTASPKTQPQKSAWQKDGVAVVANKQTTANAPSAAGAATQDTNTSSSKTGGRGNKGQGSNRGYNTGKSRGGRGGSRNVPAPEPADLTPFDFEKANSLFDKDKLKEAEGGPLEVLEGDQREEEILPAYQKDSFFDQLSCETLDKQNRAAGNSGRMTMDEQRRRDMETFGAVSVNNNNRHRGRGGRRYNNNNNYRGYNRNYRVQCRSLFSVAK